MSIAEIKTTAEQKMARSVDAFKAELTQRIESRPMARVSAARMSATSSALSIVRSPYR